MYTFFPPSLSLSKKSTYSSVQGKSLSAYNWSSSLSYDSFSPTLPFSQSRSSSAPFMALEIPHFPQKKTNKQNCVSLCSLLAYQVLLKEDQESLKLYTVTMNFELKQKCKLFVISACGFGRWLNNFNMPFILFIISFIDISGIFSCIMTENIAQFLGAYC